jgi:hypothetical protein
MRKDNYVKKSLYNTGISTFANRNKVLATIARSRQMTRMTVGFTPLVVAHDSVAG